MTALIELYANNAYSTLGSPITSSSQTNITVSNGAVFPSPTGNQFFRLTITLAATPNTSIEIVWVTARSGNTLTVLRGQEGTTAASSWASGSLVGNEATKGTYNQFVQPYVGVDTGAVNAYVVNTPQHETVYYTGMPCTFYTSNTNTVTVPTLNLNGIGDATIKNFAGGTLIAGQVQANTPISLLYSEHFSAWLMQTALLMPNGFSPSLAVTSSADGLLTTSNTTATELGYVHNVISPIQTQLDGKTFYSDFNSVTSANGYQYLPNGLIIQWGAAVNIPVGSQTVSINLPIAWPNGYLSGTVSDVGSGCVPYAINAGTTNATIRIFAPYAFLNGVLSTTTPHTRGITSATWIVIGH